LELNSTIAYMTEHRCKEFTVGCYRCELHKDELIEYETHLKGSNHPLHLMDDVYEFTINDFRIAITDQDDVFLYVGKEQSERDDGFTYIAKFRKDTTNMDNSTLQKELLRFIITKIYD
jgi:hypothetical protein